MGNITISNNRISKFTRPHKIGIVLIGAGMIFDILTTATALNNGGHEGNPFMISMVSDPAVHALIKVLDLLVILIVLIVLSRNFKLPGRLVLIPYITVTLLFILVSMNNLRVV